MLSTFALRHTTFPILSNTYPISGYSTKPDSVYSLDFRVTKLRKKSYVILTVTMQVTECGTVTTDSSQNF